MSPSPLIFKIRCQNPNFVFVPYPTLYEKTQSHFFGPTQLVSRGIHPNVHIIKPTSKVRHTFLEETNKCLQTFRPNFRKPFPVFFILLQLPLNIEVRYPNNFPICKGPKLFLKPKQPFLLPLSTSLIALTCSSQNSSSS